MERIKRCVCVVVIAWMGIGCTDKLAKELMPEFPSDTATGDSETKLNTDTGSPASDTQVILDSETVAPASDTLIPGSCVGMRCNTPPDNVCSDGVTLAVYNPVGWCDDGECHYAFRETECEFGACVEGKCLEVPCEGVYCRTPPDPTCVNAQTLKIYNPQGSCALSNDNRRCDYASREITCEEGCQDGRCTEDPCAHTVCDFPPARYCDGNNLIVWDTIPRCDQGDCIYGEQQVNCGPLGCNDGRCASDDPCANVTCDIPPASFCSGASTLRVYNSKGYCQKGACLFTYDEIECEQGCANGRCVGDACVGVTCDVWPLSRCTDPSTLTAWNGESGACANGFCSYGVEKLTCNQGCALGRCEGEPCTGVHCVSPPSDYCIDAATLLQHNPEGACTAEGYCSYSASIITCNGECDFGTCIETAEATDTAVATDTAIPTDTEEATDTAVQTDTEPPTDTAVATDTWTFSTCLEANPTDYCGAEPCVDGVCCDTPCDQLCESCRVPGIEGRCTPIPDDIDPDNECDAHDAGACGQNGLCDGAGNCAFYGAETPCDDGNQCSDGDHCNGLGSCESSATSPNFTLCEVVTTPDRDYDICLEGTCVSPGCKDVSCQISSPHFTLADSNQTSCYNSSAGITCPEEGVPYFGQDAVYGWYAENDGSTRFERSEPMPDQPVVLDTLTGLTWQGCTAGLEEITCLGGLQENLGFDDALVYCDGLDWGGESDWRLPDPFELMSIVSYESGVIDTVAFPETVEGFYWTSSVFVDSTTQFWAQSFGGSGERSIVAHTDGSDAAFRCVRGDPTPKPVSPLQRDISIYTNPVVLDTATGIMWQGCIGGLSGSACDMGSQHISIWEGALSYCENLAWAGHTNWRVPNVLELRTLVDTRREGPVVDDTDLFPGTTTELYWTSTTADANEAYVVDFDEGGIINYGKDQWLPVRCMRIPDGS